MSLDSYLAAVLGDGRVRVPPPGEIPPPPPQEESSSSAPAAAVPSHKVLLPGESDDDRRLSRQRLTEYERDFRETLAGDPPAFDLDVALAAAGWMYRACQCLVFRHLDPDDVLSLLTAARRHPALRRDATTPAPASVHYSVDCGCAALPDVIRLARIAARNDPLVEHLVEFGTCWPLSSVGATGITCELPAEISQHPALRQLFVDRVIQREDAGRIQEEPVRDLVAAAVGLHAPLAGELATLLKPETARATSAEAPMAEEPSSSSPADDAGKSTPPEPPGAIPG